MEENGWELNETRYYGTYGDCVVLFGAGVQQAVETKLIAGEEFTYNRSFALEVYQGGEFTILEQAYAHGLVSKEQVSLIAEYHRLAEEYRNGVN